MFLSTLQVFQRRIDGSTDFYRFWEGYKYGFGNANAEYWLGNNSTFFVMIEILVKLLDLYVDLYVNYMRFLTLFIRFLISMYFTLTI